MGGGNGNVHIEFTAGVEGILSGLRQIDAEAKRIGSSTTQASAASIPPPSIPPPSLPPAQQGALLGQQIGARRTVLKATLEDSGLDAKAVKSQLAGFARNVKNALNAEFGQIFDQTQLKDFHRGRLGAQRSFQGATVADLPSKIRSFESTPENKAAASIRQAAVNAEIEDAKLQKSITEKNARDRKKEAGKYRASEDEEAIARKKINKARASALAAERLVGNQGYIGDKTRKFAADQESKIETDQDQRRYLKENPEVLKNIAKNKAEQVASVKEQSLAEQQALRDLFQRNEANRQTFGQEAATRRANLGIIQKAEAEALKADPSLRRDIVGGKAAQTSESAVQKAQVEKILSTDQEYIRARGESAALVAKSNAAISLNTELSLSADDTYVKNKALAAALQQRTNTKSEAITASALAADDSYLKARTELAIASQARVAKEKIAIAQALNKDPVQRTLIASGEVATKKSDAQTSAIVDKQLATDKEYYTARAESVVTQKLLNSRTEQSAAEIAKSVPGYVQAVAAGTIAQKTLNAEIEVAIARGLGGEDLAKLRGEAAALQAAANTRASLFEQQALVNDEAYNKNKTELALVTQARAAHEKIALAKATTNEQRTLVASGEVAQKRGTAQTTARVDKELATDGLYLQARSESVVAQKLLTANIDSMSARLAQENPLYVAAVSDGILAQKKLNLQIEAAVARGLNTDAQIQARAEAAAIQKSANTRAAAIEAQLLGADDVYLKARTDLAIATLARTAREKVLLAAALENDPLLSASIAQNRVADKKTQIVDKSKDDAALAEDPEVAKARAVSAATLNKQNADLAIETEKYAKANTDYITKITEGSAAQARLNAVIEAAAAKKASEDTTTSELVAQTNALTKARLAAEQANTEAILAADDDYIASRVKLAAATAERAAKESILLAEQYKEDPSRAQQIGKGRAAADFAKAEEGIATSTEKLKDPKIIESEATDIAARKVIDQQRTIASETMLLGDKKYIAGQAEILALQQKRKLGEAVAASTIEAQKARAAIELQTLKNSQAYAALTSAETQLGAEMLAIKAQTAVLEQTKASSLKAQISAEQRVNVAYLEAKAQETVNTELAAKALLERTNILRVQNGLAAKTPAGVGGGSGSPGVDNFTAKSKGAFGPFLGGGLASTVRYAVPSIALFGAASGISKSIKEANELNVELARLEGQFNATFGADSQAELAKFKKGILESAKATGTPAQDVADIARQLQGAFGADTGVVLPDAKSGADLSGTDLVNEQKQAVLELMKVMGLSKEEAIDAGTAISLSFGVTARAAGDVTQKLEDLTGVKAAQTFSAIADSAPAAAEAGYTLEQYSALITTIQQKSGRSGTAIAESLNRILPGVTANKAALLELSATEEALNNQDFLASIANNKASEVLDQIGASFDSLSKRGKDYVIDLLGGEKNAKDLIPALQSDAQRRNLIVEIEDGGSADALSNRFTKVMDTLQGKLEKLGVEMRELGIKLIEGGLDKVLNDAVSLVSTLTKGFAGAALVATKINDKLGGLPILLGEALALAKGIQIALNAATGVKLLGTVATALGGAQKLADGSRAAVGVSITSKLKSLVGIGTSGAASAAPIVTGATTAAGLIGASIVESSAIGAAGFAAAIRGSAGTASVTSMFGSKFVAGLKAAPVVGPATGASMFGSAGAARLGATGAAAAAGGSAASTGGIAAFGSVGPAAIALAGGVIAVKLYGANVKRIKEANEKLFKELKEQSLDDIASADLGKSSFGDTIRESIFQGSSKEEIRARAARARESVDISDAVNFARQEAELLVSQLLAPTGQDDASIDVNLPTGVTKDSVPDGADQTYTFKGNKWIWNSKGYSWELLEIGGPPGSDYIPPDPPPVPTPDSVRQDFGKDFNESLKSANAKDIPLTTSLKRIVIGSPTTTDDVNSADILAGVGGADFTKDVLEASEVSRARAQEIIDAISAADREQLLAFGRGIEATASSVEGFDSSDALKKNNSKAEALQLLIDGNEAAIRELANDGDLGGMIALKILEDNINNPGAIADVIANAERAQEAIARLGGKIGENGSAVELEKLLGDFEVGEATSQEVLDQYDGVIDAYQQLADASGDPEDALALGKMIKAKSSFYATALQKNNLLIREIRDLSGRSESESQQQELDQNLAALSDPEFTDYDARQKAARDVIAAVDAQFEAMISEAKTAVEAAQIAREGVEIPPEVRKALIVEQVKSTGGQAYKDFAEDYKTATGLVASDLIANIIALVSAGPEGAAIAADLAATELGPIIASLMNKQADDQMEMARLGKYATSQSTAMAALQAVIDARAAEIDYLVALVADPTDGIEVPGTTIKADPKEQARLDEAALKEVKEKEDKFRDYVIARRKALVGLYNAIDGPDELSSLNRNLSEAYAEIGDANAKIGSSDIDESRQGEVDKINAQTSVVEAQRAIKEFGKKIKDRLTDQRKALVELANAIDGADSFSSLARNVEEANRDIQDALQLQQSNDPEERAQGIIDQLNAQKAKVEGQRAQRNALRDLRNAENDYLIAVIEGVGDTVKIAKLTDANSRTILAEMIASRDQGLGDYTDQDIAQQKAQVIRDGTAVRDAQYQKANDDIDFNLTMERITKGQAVAQLQAMRALYANNETITREIDRKIKDLEGSLNSELKYNIPKLLGLPTLYEVRRLNQTPNAPTSAALGGGTSSSIGYQDNRNVQIYLTTNTGLQEAQAMEIIGDAIGNNRNGVDVRRY